MKQHVVKYPSSIRKSFDTMVDVCRYKGTLNLVLYNLLYRAGLPNKTLFYLTYIQGGTSFTILLPTGEIFGGVSILKRGDNRDDSKAAMIAAGRAIAVYKHAKRQLVIKVDASVDKLASLVSHWEQDYRRVFVRALKDDPCVRRLLKS